MNNTIYTPVSATIIKETAKAYQISLSYWTSITTPIKNANVWVPKSCAEVTDGKVTGVADWILTQWVNEYAEYIKKTYSNRAASKFNPSFDISAYHAGVASKKAEEQKYKGEFNAAIAAVVRFVTPYATEQMQRLGYVAKVVSDKYAGTGILTDSELEAFTKISTDIEKEFGTWKDASSQFVQSFVSRLTTDFDTTKKLAGYLWEEVEYTVFGVDLYRYENRRQVKYEDGREVPENMIYTTIRGVNGCQEESFVGKKFKKNFTLHEELKNLVDSIFKRIQFLK